MTASMIMAAMLAAQGVTVSPLLETDTIQQKDAAFEDIAAGKADSAIILLKAGLVEEPGDPALLINLGAAYEQTGDLESAARAYRAAMDSRTRYQLELADGRWMDSRRAAQIALSKLEMTGTIALR
ncbi:cytochrome c-type biogenesis protein CcmH/NrfG [Altererythrobacter atlanticus]|uniref:Uncharacterized protein n=1 Tax=Croceibacterium atlanticum TaxID=1267766 RepID=A0A0F7KXJ0_9SPHN|nr:tetratricopeptide repeat protein [Croceibacterium atlanticum]AKH43941.1 hypothetical protein WYH_02914 [Croceibacterium atlanticum]MBB5733609.1 cytochrome c-type biogenesis protein CcmH/NrfG [Croceibacterium atlanticum]